MVDTKGFVFWLVFLIMISSVSAEFFGYDYLPKKTSTINYSITNTNSSEFWDALDTPADIVGLLMSQISDLWNTVVQSLTSISPYIIVNDTTDNILINFNETLLNTTIDARAGAGGDYYINETGDTLTGNISIDAGAGFVDAINGSYIYLDGGTWVVVG